MHDVQWLAGLYEGEGTVGNYAAGKNRTARQTRIAIVSTDRDVLETAQQVAGGLGHINLARAASDRHKACYVWHVGRREHIIELGELLLPYLHERRRAQLEPVIAWCREAIAKRTTTGQGWRRTGATNHAKAPA